MNVVVEKCFAISQYISKTELCAICMIHKVIVVFENEKVLTKETFSVLLVKGRTGKNLLMLNGYTYYQHKILRDGFRWSCTQMGSRSCRGYLHVTNDMMVVRAHVDHTHPPSTYFLEKTKNNQV